MVVSVVGLFDDRRVAEFQKPSVYMAIADVQELALAPNAVSVIDIMLEDSSPNSLAQTQTELEKLLAEKAGVWALPRCIGRSAPTSARRSGAD